MKVALRLLAMLTDPKAAAAAAAAAAVTKLGDLCQISMQILLSCWLHKIGEHGRELVTLEVALRLLAMLADGISSSNNSWCKVAMI